jgi:hypothetical protein
MTAYPTRTIAYICEIYHASMPPATESIQRLHNRYFEDGNPPYSSFAVSPAGPVLSNPGMQRGVLSQVAFLPDRIQFREELGAMTAEDFGLRVRRIAGDVASERSMEAYAGQRITIRTLLNPRKFGNSIEYMRDGLFGFGDMIDAFEGQPRIYGLRMDFPPSEECRTANSLRIENYFQDERTLFMENQSSAGPVRVSDQLEHLEENVSSAYSFLIDKASSFVQAFDLRLEE